MPLNEVESVQGHIGMLLIELDLIEEQLLVKELKPHELRSLSSQLERVRAEYMPLAGQLQGLGAPSSNQDSVAVMKRLFAARSRLSSSCPAAPLAASGSSAAGSSSNQIQAKLPQIHLPVFSGDTEEWLAWSRAFCSAVDSRNDLASDAKLQYLITSVSGEALRLVSESEATGASYATVMKELKHRYEHRPTILKYYLQRLLNPGCATELGPSLRELLDRVRGAGNSLMARGYSRAELFDAIGCYVLLENLPEPSRAAWDLVDRDEFSFSELCKFIENRARKAPVAPDLPSKASPSPTSKSDASAGLLALTWRQRDTPQRDKRYTFAVDARGQCIGCGIVASHPLYQCPEYRRLDVPQRLRIVRASGRCENCLAPGHRIQDCRSRSCMECGGGHHTSLHDAPRGAAAHVVIDSPEIPDGEELHDRSESSSQPQSAEPGSAVSTKAVQVSAEGGRLSSVDFFRDAFASPVVATVAASLVEREPSIYSGLPLLATAVIWVETTSGAPHAVRALVDPASQVTLVSTAVVDRLGWPVQPVRGAIGLAAAREAYVRGAVEFNVVTDRREFVTRVSARVVDRVTGLLPSSRVDVSGGGWDFLKGYRLADPEFFIPGIVDVLLDAAVFADAVGDVIARGPAGYPVLVGSVFGGLLFGRCPGAVNRPLACVVADGRDVRQILERFWTIETCPLESAPVFEDDALVERHFKETHSRTPDGRFVVRLPFRSGASGADLGLSRTQAARRLQHLQARRLTPEYVQFMDEYLALGHMSRRSSETTPYFYIPHHPIYRGGKLRVVFDASAKTSSGNSLNDLLLIGPTIQPDLFAILVAFRAYPVAIKADIIKMYRQVRLDPRDIGYQTILWSSPEGQACDFSLDTVTYGVSAAPYLAIRCLFQLADDHGDQFPLAATAIRRSFYVDDVLSGADSVADAAKLVTQLQGLLSLGQFYLSKWAASSSELGAAIQADTSMAPVSLFEDTTALGVLWDPECDSLSVRVPATPSDATMTKSSVLSFVASVFDPLGLLAPVTIRGKLFLQELWRSEAAWSDPVSLQFASRFRDYCEELQTLSTWSVPRWTGQSSQGHRQYVGFADASERACAACVFVRVPVDSGFKLRLICAKTQVAPIKSVSLPRLELVACLLLARLMRSVLVSHQQESQHVILFSDSSIALAWIAKPAATWRCFVANRVAKIQDRFPSHQWHHVAGHSNPADLATRGVFASELSNSSLWWDGPSFLRDSEFRPSPPVAGSSEAVEAEQRPPLVAAAVGGSVAHPWFSISYDYFRLVRIFAYVALACRRFHAVLDRETRPPPPKRKKRYHGPPLAVVTRSRSNRANANSSHPPIVPSLQISESRPQMEDFFKARDALTRLAQQDCFLSYIHSLSKEPTHQRFPKSQAWFAALAPFLDKFGIVRVGGRLRHAELPYAARHQSLIPTRHPLFRAWVMGLHIKYFHTGPTLILSLIRRSHWPVPDAAREARKIVSSCVKCRRFNPSLNQRMGELPSPRVRPAPPFSHTGVDFAGPFLLRRRRGRRSQVDEKVWAAVFVCMATKAVHIEIADGCSVAEFLDVFARFSARRGYPSHIYSDCGTNFQGAESFFKQLSESATVSGFLASQGLSWHFNPPAAPHFGGLWEAAVKAVKRHLFRAIPSRVFSRSELSSLLIQIEGCLNSRPLVSLSSDVSCSEALTPAHFLVGRPLFAPPIEEVPGSAPLKVRWRELQAALSAFWRVWSREYLHQMQQRPRWRFALKNLKIDDIVVIQEPTPPSSWRLGRVVEVKPGSDGLVRVARVRVSSGAVFERSVRSLVPLLDDE